MAKRKKNSSEGKLVNIPKATRNLIEELKKSAKKIARNSKEWY